MAFSPSGKPMRKNAQANRERILTAAEDVFGASGAAGSTEDVAHQAGVGIATVFRHFPTKEALLEATLVRHLQRLNEQAAELAIEPDQAQALRRLVATMIATGSTKLTLISLVSERGDMSRAVQEAASALRITMCRILEGAKTTGAVRADVTVDELVLLIRALAQAAATRPTPPETLSRAMEIIHRGLAAPG
jgi:AcrR family transcriptional regulator